MLILLSLNFYIVLKLNRKTETIATDAVSSLEIVNERASIYVVNLHRDRHMVALALIKIKMQDPNQP